MNTLSLTLDFPKLIVSSGQIDIREDVNQRIHNIINNLKRIDSDIDQAMDGWRLKRLPRIDRDILRLAYVDINFLNTPVSVILAFALPVVFLTVRKLAPPTLENYQNQY